jgi:hypothetical protein
VGGVGIAYEGESESEARRQFGLFLNKSKTSLPGSAGKSITLFKNYDILQYYPARYAIPSDEGECPIIVFLESFFVRSLPPRGFDLQPASEVTFSYGHLFDERRQGGPETSAQ